MFSVIHVLEAPMLAKISESWIMANMLYQGHQEECLVSPACKWQTV